MKLFHLILLISLTVRSELFAAPRTRAKNTESKPQVVYVPIPVNQPAKTPQLAQNEMDPIERDKIIDNQLFAHFMSILGNFGKIIINPHDKENVTTHVSQMIDGIVAVAHTVTRVQRSPQKLNRLVQLFIQHFRHLQYQRANQKRAIQQA